MQSSSSSMSFFHPFRKPCLSPLSLFAYELKIISRDQRSPKIFGLLLFDVFCILLISSWCYSTNSLALAIFSTLVWIDLLSLLTCLLGFWVEQKKPNKIFTYGHGRCEILAVFIVAIVTQISSLVIMKESFLRLSHPPWVSTGRLFLGALLCLICHLITTYVNDKGRAFNHVLSSSSSNILQEQLTKFSQSLCQLIPGLSALLLPRANPFKLLGYLGFVLVFISQILIDVYNWHSADAVFSLLIGIAILITMFPICVYTARILLQAAPAHTVNHLEKCLREASTLDGVLEFRNERFWTLGFGNLVGTLHVRIRRDANEQVVLSHLSNRLSNLVSDLTIQVFKDEWAWNPNRYNIHKNDSMLKYTTTPSPVSPVSSPVSASHHSNLSTVVSMDQSLTSSSSLVNNNNHSISHEEEKWVQNV